MNLRRWAEEKKALKEVKFLQHQLRSTFQLININSPMLSRAPQSLLIQWQREKLHHDGNTTAQRPLHVAFILISVFSHPVKPPSPGYDL